MNMYLEFSTEIYNVYLKYISPDDIYVYSIDEVFCDITDYLKYNKNHEEKIHNTPDGAGNHVNCISFSRSVSHTC